MAKERLLRNWTDSEAMDSLSPQAEVFFTRLIMVADDHGSYHANPKLLKAGLFPLKAYSDVKVSEWLDECITAGLIYKYEVGGKTYIRIDNFGQRLRNMRNLFPAPIEKNSPQVAASRGESAPEVEEETEEEKEDESEIENEVEAATAEVWPRFDDWWDLYDKKTGRPKCEKLWKKIPHPARADIMAHTEQYVKATPDKQYRKNPTTYLNNESWNDEIIDRTHGTGIAKELKHTVDSIDALIASRDYSRAGPGRGN